jgi:hypothetical protein
MAVAVAAVIAGCAEPRPDTGDFGPFLPLDAASAAETGADASAGMDAWCFGAGGPKAEVDLSVVGQMFEMSWTNMFPGDYRGDVLVKIFDLCGAEVRQFTVLPTGSFAFHMPVDVQGFNGYFEFPFKPDGMDDAAYPFAGYPLFREFDKPFAGQYIHSNVRMFAPDIITFATAIVKQEEEKGYVQGTVYRWLDYVTLDGVVVQPSSGKLWYISNAHIPDAGLATTQNKGMFVVANADPGPFALTFELPSGKSFTKEIYTWPFGDAANGLVTNTGVPVAPEYL